MQVGGESDRYGVYEEGVRIQEMRGMQGAPTTSQDTAQAAVTSESPAPVAGVVRSSKDTTDPGGASAKPADPSLSILLEMPGVFAGSFFFTELRAFNALSPANAFRSGVRVW